MTNKSIFGSCKRITLLFIMLCCVMLAIAGCNKADNNSEGGNDTRSDTAASTEESTDITSEVVTEEEPVNNLTDIPGEFYEGRTDVKDIRNNIEELLNISGYTTIIPFSNMKLLVVNEDYNLIRLNVYDIETGEHSDTLEIKVSEYASNYYVYDSKYIVYTDISGDAPRIVVCDDSLKEIRERAVPSCSEEELANKKEYGTYDVLSGYYYNYDSDILLYTSGYGDVTGYSYENESYINYYSATNDEWGNANFITNSSNSKEVVVFLYGDKDESKFMIDMTTNEVEQLPNVNIYCSGEGIGSERNARIFDSNICAISSDYINATPDYTIEYESAEIDWKNNKLFTYVENNKIVDGNSTVSYTYNAYDFETGEITACLWLNNLNRNDYISTYNSKDRIGGINACGEVAVIVLIDFDGYIKNVLLWDFNQEIVDKPIYDDEELCLVNHEYDELSCEDIKSMLEEKYDIEILYGEETDNVRVNDIDMTALYDEVLLKGALINLKETLELFPDNLFSQLKYIGAENKCRFYLCKSLNIVDNGIDEIGAHCVCEGASVIVLDADIYTCLYKNTIEDNNLRTTIVHELIHAITEYTDINYEEWFLTSPEDFEYYGDYAGYEEHDDSARYTVFDPDGEIYFVNAYSKVSMLEELAVLYEYSLFPSFSFEQETLLSSPHIQSKLKLFNSWIRSSYDTTNWPATTFWEETVK